MADSSSHPAFPVNQILSLQRYIGNRVVGSLVQSNFSRAIQGSALSTASDPQKTARSEDIIRAKTRQSKLQQTRVFANTVSGLFTSISRIPYPRIMGVWIPLSGFPKIKVDTQRNSAFFNRVTGDMGEITSNSNTGSQLFTTLNRLMGYFYSVVISRTTSGCATTTQGHTYQVLYNPNGCGTGPPCTPAGPNSIYTWPMN